MMFLLTLKMEVEMLKDLIDQARKQVTSVKSLDDFLGDNKDNIVVACTILPIVNGVKLRVATAVVVLNSAGDSFYLYRRTPEGEERRGIPEKWDTPKGRVPFIAPGKWAVDESLITGEVDGVALATEYNPSGKFAEYVHMPVVVFRVDAAGQKLLDDSAGNVPADMGDVKGYEWIPVTDINHENAMTKVLAAASVL